MKVWLLELEVYHYLLRSRSIQFKVRGDCFRTTQFLVWTLLCQQPYDSISVAPGTTSGWSSCSCCFDPWLSQALEGRHTPAPYTTCSYWRGRGLPPRSLPTFSTSAWLLTRRPNALLSRHAGQTQAASSVWYTRCKCRSLASTMTQPHFLLLFSPSPRPSGRVAVRGRAPWPPTTCSAPSWLGYPGASCSLPCRPGRATQSNHRSPRSPRSASFQVFELSIRACLRHLRSTQSEWSQLLPLQSFSWRWCCQWW